MRVIISLVLIALFLWGLFSFADAAVPEIIIPSNAIVISPDQSFSLRDVTEGLDYVLVDYRGTDHLANAEGIVVHDSSEIIFLTSFSQVDKAKDLAFAELKQDKLIVYDLSDFKVSKISYNAEHTELVIMRNGFQNYYAAPSQLT